MTVAKKYVYYKCSECGEPGSLKKTFYCYNCGKEVKGKREYDIHFVPNPKFNDPKVKKK